MRWGMRRELSEFNNAGLGYAPRNFLILKMEEETGRKKKGGRRRKAEEEGKGCGMGIKERVTRREEKKACFQAARPSTRCLE